MVKIKGMTKNEARAISEYGKLLLKKFPNRLSRILLFGSKARGDSNRNSDVDLLIVLTRNGRDARRKIAELTHEPIARFRVLLSPVIVKEDFFKDWSPLLEHIKKDGITIWTNKKARGNM